MTAALHGNLRDFGMGEVFQLIGQQRKSGMLAVQAASGGVELAFDEGRIVSAAPVGGGHEQAALGEMLVRSGRLTRERLAELEAERETALCSLSQLLADRGALTASEIEEAEDLLTRDTLFDLLRWTEGSFRFDAKPVHHSRDPSTLLGAEQVLMDGLRMVDEWRTFVSKVPSEAGVFRRAGRFEDYRRTRDGSEADRLAREERVFLLVDGRSPVRRVIDLSRLGSFEGTRVLAALRDARLIEPVRTPAGVGERLPRRRPVRSGPRRLATVLAFVALSVMALTSHLGPGERQPVDGISVQRDPFEEARVGFATRGARHLLETYRFANGMPPRTLSELARWGEYLDPALAAPPPDAYYRTEGRRAWLLAPEH